MPDESGSLQKRPQTKRAYINHRWGKGRGGRPWQRKRERIFKRDKFLCQIHLRQGQLVPVELHGRNAGICDHVVPLSQGGKDDDSNLETICQQCDKIKSRKEAGGKERLACGVDGWPVS